MLFQDIKNNNYEEIFIDSINSFFYEDIKRKKTNRSPEELLRDVDYTLYECKSENDIQKFKKYYKKAEELCTFDGGRLKKCHVFFAIRDDADILNRNDFLNPKREGIYGTSVISIQFSRGKSNTLSIKNRYNHTVPNPDATYSNNLDNIIEGLTFAFEEKYNLKINNCDSKLRFLGWNLNYVKANNGKYYRYNCKKREVYYCENNIIIDDGKIIDKYSKEKERYILMDCFILDLKHKKIFLYDRYLSDAFMDIIGKNKINKIKINKTKNNKEIILELVDNKEIKLLLDKCNSIVGYKDCYVETIGDSFLCINRNLNYLFLPNVESIGNGFLKENISIIDVDLPKIKTIGNDFLSSNPVIRNCNISNVQSIGDSFLKLANCLSNIYLPKVKTIGSYFLLRNHKISSIFFPELISIGYGFLLSCHQLKEITIPKVENFNYRDLIYNNPSVNIFLSSGKVEITQRKNKILLKK